MHCPRCRDDLRQTERTGVSIDYCPRCRGVWLDGGELEKLIDRSQSWDYGPQNYPSQPDAGYQGRPAPAYREDHRRDHHDRDDYRGERRHDQHYRGDHHNERYDKRHKKKSLLGEIFDIFD